MIQIVRNIRYDSFREFYENVISLDGNIKRNLQGYIFRGEGSNTYQLLPSALRNDSFSKIYYLLGEKGYSGNSPKLQQEIIQEYDLIKDFYKQANYNGLLLPRNKEIENYYELYSLVKFKTEKKKKFKWLGNDLIEIAALAQHYGLPTRLLDWTQDIFTALYFAAIGGIEKIKNEQNTRDECIVVWALNLRYLQHIDYKRHKSRVQSPLPLKFIIPPYNNNPNLNSQKGVLTHWEIEVYTSQWEQEEIDKTPLDILLENLFSQQIQHNHRNTSQVFYKFEVPINESFHVYDFIDNIQYTAGKLFPGYAGIVQMMKDRSLYMLAKKKVFNSNAN
jgi:hypothetical protein